MTDVHGDEHSLRRADLPMVERPPQCLMPGGQLGGKGGKSRPSRDKERPMDQRYTFWI